MKAGRRKTDSVNPAHYQGDYVMRIIEDFGLDFCTGTAVKYLLRGRKEAGAAGASGVKEGALVPREEN